MAIIDVSSKSGCRQVFCRGGRLYRPCDDRRSRQGVALIIVLGMLSFLMILGVAFSITMRTERMSASFYVHQIRGEHLAHAAIARAMNRIATTMGDAFYPDWGEIDGQRSLVLGSQGIVPCKTLMTDSIRQALPDLVAAQADTYVDNDNVRWVNLQGSDGSVLGAIAYLILNTSGLLDVNRAGGVNIDRHYGTNANEIAIDVLPGMVNANLFVGDREQYVRHESMQEVWALHGDGGTDRLDEMPLMNVRPPVPLSRWDTDSLTHIADQVAIGGSVDELYNNRDDIIAAFEAAGISGATVPDINLTYAEIAFRNLMDYVDDDKLPGNMGGKADVDARIPSVEPNPMFNEFEVEYTIDVTTNATGWDFEVTGRVDFELGWFFPVSQFSGTYSFNHSVTFESTASGGGSELAAAKPTTPSQFQISTAPASSPGFFTFDVDIPRKTGTLNALPGSFEIRATVTTWTRSGANVVDTNMPLTVSLPFTIPAGATMPFSHTERAGMECRDPRLNYFDRFMGIPIWEPTGASAASSINAMNLRAQNMLDDDFETDGHAAFFVPNRPLLSVGELGYLFYGEPWQTIRLYKHQGPGGLKSDTLHTVLDHFVLTEEPWGYGLLNPNTEILWALTAALKGMPYNEDADEDTPALTLDQAMELAEVWASEVVQADYLSNLSDIGELTGLFYHAGSEVDVASWIEPQKEALIRNVAGLMHPRQNHFTIIVAVNTFGAAGAAAGAQIGQRRLMAEVWRDPGRNSGTYLRLLRWVD